MVPSAAKYKAAGANSARSQKRHRHCRAGPRREDARSLRPVELAACPEKKVGGMGPSGPSFLPPRPAVPPSLGPEQHRAVAAWKPGEARAGRPRCHGALKGALLAALSFCGDAGSCFPRLSLAGAAPRSPGRAAAAAGGQAGRRGGCPCPDKAPSRGKGSPLSASLQVLRATERPQLRVPPGARIRRRCPSWCRTLPAPSRPLSASVRQQGREKNVPRKVAQGMEGATGRQGQSPQLKV